MGYMGGEFRGQAFMNGDSLKDLSSACSELGGVHNGGGLPLRRSSFCTDWLPGELRVHAARKWGSDLCLDTQADLEFVEGAVLL